MGLDKSVFSSYTLGMTYENRELLEQIFLFINKIIFLEKRNIFQLKGVKLYPSEIHLVLFINNERDSNITRIAEKLGLTKGAVSQTLTRLEKKNIVRKTKDPFNKNELTVSFTPFGKEVIGAYVKTLKDTHEQYDRYLSSLREEERSVIKKFIQHIEAMLDSLG